MEKHVYLWTVASVSWQLRVMCQSGEVYLWTVASVSLQLRVMCQSGEVYLWTVASVSLHYKTTTKPVGLVQSRHHYHLIKYNLFLPWYSWKKNGSLGIKQQCFTHSEAMHNYSISNLWSRCLISQFLMYNYSISNLWSRCLISQFFSLSIAEPNDILKIFTCHIFIGQSKVHHDIRLSSVTC